MSSEFLLQGNQKKKNHWVVQISVFMDYNCRGQREIGQDSTPLRITILNFEIEQYLYCNIVTLVSEEERRMDQTGGMAPSAKIIACTM